MKKFKFFSMIDYILLFCVLTLTALGISFIYSAGVNSHGVQVSKEYIKQIIWASIGLLAMFGFCILDYRKIKKYIPIVFGVILFILMLTLKFGKKVNGAKSWFGIGELGIQPAEITKVIYIMFLAWFLEKSEMVKPLYRFLISLGIFTVPFGLILLQPDLGTATVYIPIFLFMCFFAGIPLRYIMMVLLFGVTTIVLTVLPILETYILKKSIPAIQILTVFKLRLIVILVFAFIFAIGLIGRLVLKKKWCYWICYFSGIFAASLVASLILGKVLKEYQIQRLVVFIDPYSDPRGFGWNIIQSKIAIGSGSLMGRGFLQGTQSHYNFLPEHSTDFIFSILGEEMGFIGGIFVFILFFAILVRTVFIIKNTTNKYGMLISVGILAMLFFHFIVNVGMDIGIMPITGIPFPFLSYGGSALLTNMISIGILMSINYRRLDYDSIG